jgi:hypothetical protein
VAAIFAAIATRLAIVPGACTCGVFARLCVSHHSVSVSSHVHVVAAVAYAHPLSSPVRTPGSARRSAISPKRRCDRCARCARLIARALL